MQLEEAKQLAQKSARISKQSWYVIRVDDDYRVVSKSDLDRLPGHAHSVVYGASPEK
jgi:hypothetical protein